MAYLGITPLQGKEGEFHLSVCKGYRVHEKLGSALHLIRCLLINTDRIPLFILPVSQ